MTQPPGNGEHQASVPPFNQPDQGPQPEQPPQPWGQQQSPITPPAYQQSAYGQDRQQYQQPGPPQYQQPAYSQDQPQYQQPYYAGPAAPKKRKMPWLIGAGVLVVVGAVLGILFGTGVIGGDDGGGSNDPNSVAERAATAYKNHDVALAKQIACSPANVDENDSSIELVTDARVDGPADVKGDTATVPFTLTVKGYGDLSDEITLQRRADSWCITGNDS